MSMISQNVNPKDRDQKIKSKAHDETSGLDEKSDIEDWQESDLDTFGSKKKKKERKGVDKQLVMEEEKEMKKIENLLFGSLHSPVEFGKDEEEEEDMREEVDNSTLFFMDRSANRQLYVYEEDFPEESRGEVETRQRKSVWVDEEEEKTNINVAEVNRLRKPRKEEDERIISGASYVSKLRAPHEKLNRGIEWAQLDLRDKNYGFDGEYSDSETGAVLASGYKDDGDVNDILRTNKDLVVKSSGKLL